MGGSSSDSFWFDVLIGPLVGMVHRPALEMARPLPGERILEIGAGTALQLRRYAGDGRALLGVDHDPGMAARAVRNLRGRGAMVLGDATRLPVPSCAFDIVLCSLVIHEMPPASRPVLLEEAFRALREGGRFVLIDFDAAGESGVGDGGIRILLLRRPGTEDAQRLGMGHAVPTEGTR